MHEQRGITLHVGGSPIFMVSRYGSAFVQPFVGIIMCANKKIPVLCGGVY